MFFKLYLFVFVCFLNEVNSLNFYLKANDQRCIQEELNKDVLLIGEYEIKAGGDQRVNILVTDTKRHVLSQTEDVKKPGKFSVVLEKRDRIDVCFESITTSRTKKVIQVFFAVKKGVETKKYEEVSQVSKLEPIEREMAILEDKVHEMIRLFIQMKHMERKMSVTNESTNNRVYYLGVFNFLWIFGLAAAQILYFRWYFLSKKLIE